MNDMTAFRIAGAAAALTVGACYFSGRSFGEALGCGLGVGAVAGVTAKVLSDRGALARANVSKSDIEHGYGALKPPALRMLAQINSSALFAPRQIDGWVIGEVPANEYAVHQLP